MGFTILGVVLGAFASWVITHAYYRVTEKKASQENPFDLIEQVSSDIEAIKSSLANQSPSDPSLAEALRKSLEQIERVKPGRMGKFFAHADCLLFHLSPRIV